MKHWLPDMDLNHDKQIQSLLCYRYTIGQAGAEAKLGGFVNQSSRRWLSGSIGAQKSNRVVLRLFWLLWLLPVLGQAQFYPPILVDASATKFLDEEAAFSGTVEMTVRAGAGKPDKVPVHFAILNGATRVEMDITKVEQGDKARNNPVWKSYLDDMKAAGSAESIAIFNPAKKSVFIILPKLKVYLRRPIPDKQLDELKRRPLPERTELAKETLDGHPCTKFRLSFDKATTDAWRTWETPSAIVWAAGDLKGHPLRIEVINSLDETNSTMVFKKLDLRQPEAGLFDAPAGFIECSDEQELMGHIMKKWPKKE